MRQSVPFGAQRALQFESVMLLSKRPFAQSTFALHLKRRALTQPQPSFLQEYNMNRRDIPKSVPETDTMQQIAGLTAMDFEIEEEQVSPREKQLLAASSPTVAPPADSAREAVSAHLSAIDSKSLMIHQLHEQRAQRLQLEARPEEPAEIDPAEFVKNAQKRLDENQHESALLRNGHKELTLKLKVLYHKLHCANVMSLSILNKREKSMYQYDRRIDRLAKKLKRLRAIRQDKERLAKNTS